MPLSPAVARQLHHVRRVTYQGFARDDGLWDMEGELHDSKAFDAPAVRQAQGLRRAGEPIHHMRVRVTVDVQLTVQAIEVAMEAHPLQGCREAEAALQRLVGTNMARGWRQSLQKHLGGVASCTHVRELLLNLATATFQTLPSVFAAPSPDQPPRHLGQCTGWDYAGSGVQEFYPQFYQRPERPVEPVEMPDPENA